MRREVCFVIAGGRIAWSDVSSSPAALPDSRARWEAIWGLRDELEEVVHSHPIGPDAFSAEDVTTMDALDAALGRALRYSIVTPGAFVVRERGHLVSAPEVEPWWVPLLRAASGMTG
jgi:hypothetical protein